MRRTWRGGISLTVSDLTVTNLKSSNTHELYDYGANVFCLSDLGTSTTSIKLKVTINKSGYLPITLVTWTKSSSTERDDVVLYPDTIAGKLAKINDCKTAIRDAVAAKGVDIDGTTKLDDYAGKIESMDVITGVPLYLNLLICEYQGMSVFLQLNMRYP